MIGKVLIFFIVFANFAWAVDADAIAFTKPDPDKALFFCKDAYEGKDTHEGKDTQQIQHLDASCHHCCHASAHITAITGDAFADSINANGDVYVTRVKNFQSRDKEPPVQPPNI